jgi:hypothetical protein
MAGLRVGVEVLATPGAITATMATLPWMTPERVMLDESRALVLVSTSFDEPGQACDYAQRRVEKSASGLGLDLRILSTEAFPPVIDLRDRTSAPHSWAGQDSGPGHDDRL